MVDFHLAVRAARSDERTEIHASPCGRGDRHRHSEDIVEGAIEILRKLDTDEVLVATARIDPEIAAHGDAGIQCHDDLQNHILRREAKLGGLHAVHIEHEIGGIITLANAHIGGAGNGADEIGNLAGGSEKFGSRAALDLDIDGRSGAEVECGGNHPAGVEFRLQIGKGRILAKGLAKLDCILARRLRALGQQLNAEDRILLTGIRRVGGGPVGIQAKFRNNRRAFIRRNLAPQKLLDLLHTHLGGVETEIRGSAQADRDLP